MAYNDGFRKYENVADQTEKVFLLNLLKGEVEKKRDKWERTVKKNSEKLRALDAFTDSKKKRATTRMNVDAAAQERDRWENRLQLIEKWIEELRED